jgi:hypothetical protein
MHASVVKYTGTPTLADELAKRSRDIESVIRSAKGFKAYYLLKTSDGAVSLTVCQDRAGAEESDKLAATWIKDNLPAVVARPPETWFGEVRIQLTGQPMKVQV